MEQKPFVRAAADGLRLLVRLRTSLLVVLLAALGCSRAPVAVETSSAGSGSGSSDFGLDYGRLSAPLEAIGAADRAAVDDAIRLIEEGEHTLALLRLSALNDNNPENSSLRILASYALLRAGELLGAFEEAERAHAAADGDAYKCWFLCKIALLNGNKDLARREVSHLREVGNMESEAAELEQQIEAD